VILADAGYGTDTGFRSELREMNLPYVVGIMSSISVSRPAEEPQPAKKGKGKDAGRSCCSAIRITHPTLPADTSNGAECS